LAFLLAKRNRKVKFSRLERVKKTADCKNTFVLPRDVVSDELQLIQMGILVKDIFTYRVRGT
jgi:hypothetical protein